MADGYSKMKASAVQFMEDEAGTLSDFNGVFMGGGIWPWSSFGLNCLTFSCVSVAPLRGSMIN